MKLQRLDSGWALVLAAATLCATATEVRAQTQHDADVAVTFVAVQASHAAGTSDFRLYGGSVEVHAEFFHGLGAVANVTGVHKSTSTPLLAPLDLVTVTFGPRYTVRPKFGHHRISIFAQGLVGEADGFNGIFPTGNGPAVPPNGTTDSSNSLALQAGGGVDVRVASHFSVRVIQAEYLRTQLPNGGDNVQNNLRLAAGIVYRSHRRP